MRRRTEQHDDLSLREAAERGALGIMTPLSPAVSQRIDALFPATSRESARQMIAERCGTDLPMASPEREAASFDRIRFAVLKLSGGDLERLKREIDGAHYDWRDTLMAAGFGEDIHAHLKWNP
jgi:hypothetical protein